MSFLYDELRYDYYVGEEAEQHSLYLTATISKKDGKIAYTGKLDDGTAIKGTTYLLDITILTGWERDYFGEVAWIGAPILVTDKKKYVFSISFDVVADEEYSPVLRDGIPCSLDEGAGGTYLASSLKNKKIGDLMSDAGELRARYSGFSPSVATTDRQYATKLGTGGVVKLSFKDTETGCTSTCEMVPVGEVPYLQFKGIATGKKGKETLIGMSILYVPAE